MKRNRLLKTALLGLLACLFLPACGDTDSSDKTLPGGKYETRDFWWTCATPHTWTVSLGDCYQLTQMQMLNYCDSAAPAYTFWDCYTTRGSTCSQCPTYQQGVFVWDNVIPSCDSSTVLRCRYRCDCYSHSS